MSVAPEIMVLITAPAAAILLAATYIFYIRPYLDERETAREFETGSNPA